MKRILTIALLATFATLTLAACGTEEKPHKQYGQIYTDQAGKTYTRTYDDSGDLIWYLYVLHVATQPSPTSGNALSGGSWRTVPTAPANVTATDKVVETGEKGEPQETLENEADVTADEVTNENTTADEASADAEAANDAADSSSDNGSDSGGDSGSDSGGGDSSGADSGGSFDGGGGGDAGGGF